MFPSGSDAPLFRDAEEWQSPPFLGDFYREADTVCRGISIAPEDVSALSGPSAFKGFVDGDFYREPDDICKGVSIGDSFPLAPPLSKDFGLSTDLGYSSTVLAQKVERFVETDFPPNMPNDSFFTLEPTTLYVTSSTPFEIGNTVLDFMSQQITSTLIKVRRPKFSMKADVFTDSMMCTMKVRVYSQDSGQFAVEFQRRSGDAVSFHNTFQQAASYMKPLFVTTNAPEAPALMSFKALPFPEDFAESSMNEADLLPLLDMAGLVGAPWLQAEAATSLSLMAAQSKPVLLCPRVFQAIAELMQTNSAEVAHPTACLIFHLAHHMEAAALFASQGLLKKMLETVRSQGTHAQIRLKLAQALNEAMQKQSKATLSDNDAMDLIRTFADCASKEMLSGTLSREVIQNLEMGEHALKSKFGASGWA